MNAKVILFSRRNGIINEFLSKFYTKNLGLENSLFWKKDFSNPVDISEVIAAFVDNINFLGIDMWISLDKDVFVKISSSNANMVIKYLFERYPY